MQQPPESIRVGTNVSVVMAFACENISTDPAGRVTFHSVIDGLTAVNFPASTAGFWVVFGFVRSVSGFLMKCRVEILPPAGSPLVSQPIADIAFRPDQLAQRAICGFPGIAWPAPGEYQVRFLSMDRTIASFPLRIAQAQLAAPGPAPT